MLVALANDGIPVAGWILDPASNRFCSAQQGKDAAVSGASFTALGWRGPVVAVTRLLAGAARRKLC
jgi:3'-phosphoadenosine 5'-phosphosulfate (PAPS) 3'-phosphatase